MCLWTNKSSIYLFKIIRLLSSLLLPWFDHPLPWFDHPHAMIRPPVQTLCMPRAHAARRAPRVRAAWPAAKRRACGRPHQARSQRFSDACCVLQEVGFWLILRRKCPEENSDCWLAIWLFFLNLYLWQGWSKSADTVRKKTRQILFVFQVFRAISLTLSA